MKKNLITSNENCHTKQMQSHSFTFSNENICIIIINFIDFYIIVEFLFLDGSERFFKRKKIKKYAN